MINLRFHIVSIVAVFLALAIGILTGSTLLDRATIEVLQDRQESLDKRNAELHDELGNYKDVASDLDRAQTEFTASALPELVPGLLTDDPVLVIAPSGVDANSVTLLEQLLSDAGATTLGTVWFDKRLDLTDEARRGELADLLDVTLGEEDDERRLAAALAEILATPTPEPTPDPTPDPGAPQVGDPFGGGGATDPATDPTTDPTATDPTATDPAANPTQGTDTATMTPFELIQQLAEAELIDWRDSVGEDAQLDSFPAGKVRLIVVTGEGATLGDEAFVQPLVAELVDIDAAPLVAEVNTSRTIAQQVDDDVAAFRGGRLEFIRSDSTLRNAVVTVDNAEDAWGRLAVVLAMSGLNPRENGAYGFAESADQVLPDAEG